MIKPTKNVSASFPFESKYLDLLGNKLHYIEAGAGKPIVFIHGNATSSYLWRNVIAYLSAFGRCIALDLIGMGKSSKPQIDYSFDEHYRFVEAFLDAMNLDEITFVMHEWGGALGSKYASRHPEKVQALAFLEPIIAPLKWTDIPWSERRRLKDLRDPVKGKKMVLEKNYCEDKALQLWTVRSMTTAELEQYRTPYQDIESRKPLWEWMQQIPIDGNPAGTQQSLTEIIRFLNQSAVSKLILWAKPGLFVRKKRIDRWKKEWLNLQAINIGAGRHFLPEDQPHSIGTALARWIKQQNTVLEDSHYELNPDSSCVQK